MAHTAKEFKDIGLGKTFSIDPDEKEVYRKVTTTRLGYGKNIINCHGANRATRGHKFYCPPTVKVFEITREKINTP